MFISFVENTNHLKDFANTPQNNKRTIGQCKIDEYNTGANIVQHDYPSNIDVPSNFRTVATVKLFEKPESEVDRNEQIDELPRFVGQLKGTHEIGERQRAHFEICVQPQNDRKMKIEWLHNGKPIATANRIQMYQAFGYIAIDIHQVRTEDAGTYTVIARNDLGEAKLTTELIVKCKFLPFRFFTYVIIENKHWSTPLLFMSQLILVPIQQAYILALVKKHRALKI